MPPLTRDDLRRALHRALAQQPTCLAAWEAGSAAFGHADAHSDLDLALIVADGAEAETWDTVERTLEEIGPVAIRWVVPRTLHAGHQQRFYRLASTHPLTLADVSVMPVSRPPFFLETERHGVPRVLFDRQGMATPVAVDREALAERRRHAVAQTRVRFALFSDFVAKELDRGHLLDALHFYQGMVLAPLVTALRARHDPLRFDYGMRYLHRDLPPDHAARLLTLATARTPEELREGVATARAWLEELWA